MANYERSARVQAPLEAVWDFHSTVRGLEALTPEWMNLRVEGVRGPNGDHDPAVLETGSVLELSVRPFGIGPRQHWISEITARVRTGDTAYFRDSMTDGPFECWEHTHLFAADGEETILTDAIRFELPFGRVGHRLGRLGFLGFEPMFLYRHRRTKALLEG